MVVDVVEVEVTINGAKGGPWRLGKHWNVRVFIREEDVGMASRKAAGLDDGVDGRVGGILQSNPCSLPVVLIWIFARNDAVAAPYRAIWLGPASAETGPQPGTGT